MSFHLRRGSSAIPGAGHSDRARRLQHHRSVSSPRWASPCSARCSRSAIGLWLYVNAEATRRRSGLGAQARPSRAFEHKFWVDEIYAPASSCGRSGASRVSGHASWTARHRRRGPVTGAASAAPARRVLSFVQRGSRRSSTCSSCCCGGSVHPLALLSKGWCSHDRTSACSFGSYPSRWLGSLLLPSLAER